VDATAAANLALGRIGVGQAIAALAEQSVQAKTCNRFFDQCRQEVLRAHPWGFAKRTQVLALVAGQTSPGWGYVYQYPQDCMRIHRIGDETGIRMSWVRDRWEEWVQAPQFQYPWELGLKDDGASQVILTDLAEAWAFFTADVPNTGSWPADFGSVFAWRLAMEIGGPLQAKRDLVDAAEQRYLAWFSRAAASSMNEQRDDARGESPSITCRS
jgi:hypothetical protein